MDPKKLGKWLLGIIAVVANFLTLIAFAPQDWQTRLTDGIGKGDLALWSLIVLIYTVSLISAFLIHRIKERRMSQKNESSVDVMWVHFPISIPAAILWWRVFVDFPFFVGNDSQVSTSNAMMSIAIFPLFYMILVMVPVLLFTSIFTKWLYD